MREVLLKDLLEAGCHFGHRTNKWNPKAGAFIYKPVGDTHIIDLAKTKKLLESAAKFIALSASSGKTILFVGTKRQAASIIHDEGERIGAPYIHNRWIGGLITNWGEVKKNIHKLQDLRETLASKKAAKEYTKRERLLIERTIAKLERVYGGVVDLEKIPDILFVVDARRENTAVREAIQYNIPIVGIVDTNTDPTDISYPIPANDDAVGSIQYIVKYLADALDEGKQKFSAKKKADQEAQEKKDTEKKATAVKTSAAKPTAIKKAAQKSTVK